MLHGDADYPNHVHGADEVYVVLTGSGERSLHGRAYETKTAGGIIDDGSRFAYIVGPCPNLWSWTGDISMGRYGFT